MPVNTPKMKGAEEHELPLRAVRALRLLTSKPRTRKELADALRLSLAGVDRLLVAMRADGIEVTRTPDAKDAKRIHLSISREAALRALKLTP